MRFNRYLPQMAVIMSVLVGIFLGANRPPSLNAAPVPDPLEVRLANLEKKLRDLTQQHSATLDLVKRLRKQKADKGEAEGSIRSYLADRDFVTLKDDDYSLFRELHHWVQYKRTNDGEYKIPVFSFPHITTKNLYYGGGLYKKEGWRGLLKRPMGLDE